GSPAHGERQHDRELRDRRRAARSASHLSGLGADEAVAIGVEAALAAGKLLVQRFRGPASGVRSKSSATDLVSEADERAERTSVRYLRAPPPDGRIVAEEGSSASGRARARWL